MKIAIIMQAYISDLAACYWTIYWQKSVEWNCPKNPLLGQMDIFCQIVAQNYDSLYIMKWISPKNYFLSQISIFLFNCGPNLYKL